MQVKERKKSRILLIGSGGIGTLAALALEQGGRATVTAVLRSNYEIVKQAGFSITSCDHGVFRRWRPSQIINKIPYIVDKYVRGDDSFDYIICAIKNIPEDGPNLVDLIKSAVTIGQTTIVLIQNGLNIEKPIVKAFPHNTCLSGVSMMDACEIAPGQIVQYTSDRLMIGTFSSDVIDSDKQKDDAQEFVRVYAACGKVQCIYAPFTNAVRWRKLMYNAVWNPVCALTDLDTSRLRFVSLQESHRSPLNDLVRPAMQEIRSAAQAVHGIMLPESLIDDMIDADPIENFCVPSMLQDRRKKRFLECEFLLGEALREGSAAGVQMPVIRTLYGLCKALQWHAYEANEQVNIPKLLEQSMKRAECKQVQLEPKMEV